MRRAGAAADAFCQKPDPKVCGVLLFGDDAGHVAEQRRQFVRALGADPRRLDAGAARRDPGELHDALRARGFFEDRPYVLVTDAGDGTADAVAAAVDGLTAEDGMLIVEAGALPARSTLRKLFEAARHLMALHVLSDSMPVEEISRRLRALGLSAQPTDEAIALLAAHALDADRGQFERTLERLALFGAGAEEALSAQDVRDLLPATAEIEVDRLLCAMAHGDAAGLALRLARLAAAGASPVAVALQGGAYFRQLLTLHSARGGPEQALRGLRPPAIGLRRDALLAGFRRWSIDEAGSGLRSVYELEARLRSAGRRPDAALLQRTLMRLALSRRRGAGGSPT